MVWLQLVGFFILHVSLSKEPYKRDDILQEKHIILRRLLIVATPYSYIRYIARFFELWYTYSLFLHLSLSPSPPLCVCEEPPHIDILCSRTHDFLLRLVATKSLL